MSSMTLQLSGVHHVSALSAHIERTHAFYPGVLGLRPLIKAEVHVIVRDDLPRAKYGAGGVHHVALRVPTGQRMSDWVDRAARGGDGMQQAIAT